MDNLNHRIVFVSGGIPLGGSTTFLLNLGGDLVRRGIAVLVVSLEHDNPYACDFERLGISLHLEDEHRSVFEDRLGSILHVVRRFEPTVVVACLDATSFEILRYVPEGVIRLGMVQSHDPAVYEMVEAYAGRMDGVVGVSRAIVARLETSDAFRSIKKYYLPYGVEMPASPAPRVVHESALRILYLGRLANEQKRVYLFPEILTALHRSGIPFHWTVAGDGPPRAALEARMKSRGDQRVSFIGTVRYTDIPKLLDDNDVFLLTSDYEGLPLSLLEAMGHGLVPVVSDLESGVAQVVDQTDGALVSMNDVGGYSRAIVLLHNDREQLKLKSRAAFERVHREYSIAVMTDRWLRVLDEPRVPGKWPQQFRIKAILTDRRKWKYVRPLRWLRRIAKNIRPRPA